MRIGIYVQRVASVSGFERVVSAHVQLPLETLRRLKEAGHDVQLITTRYGRDRTLPKMLSREVQVHQVAYGSLQGDDPVMYVGIRNGIRPRELAKQLMQLRALAREKGFDILHFFGSIKMAYLAAALASTGLAIPMILTANSGEISSVFRLAFRILRTRFPIMLTSTDFIRSELSLAGIEAQVVRYGLTRPDILALGKHRCGDNAFRVLFWRDPSFENGADICLKAYEQLAPRFPDISFDMAIRPHWDPVAGIQQLSEKHANINVYEFPYKQNVTIAQLLDQTLCVLLPFRELSTHPQIVVMESMQAGVAVVTTALDSNLELIDSGIDGILVEVDDLQATVDAIEALLKDRKKAIELGRQARNRIAEAWNWDTYLPAISSVYDDALAVRRRQ